MARHGLLRSSAGCATRSHSALRRIAGAQLGHLSVAPGAAAGINSGLSWIRQSLALLHLSQEPRCGTWCPPSRGPHEAVESGQLVARCVGCGHAGTAKLRPLQVPAGAQVPNHALRVCGGEAPLNP